MALMFQVSTILCCLLPAMVLSMRLKVAKFTRHDHDYDYVETEDCKDLMGTKRCRDADIRYKICRELRGKSLCQKTCHVCHLKAPSPEVPCEDTVLGCCWDGVTRKQGLSNEGCPVCKDKEEYAGLCSRWYIYCGGRRGAKIYRDVVDKYCHRTCGKCADSAKTTEMVRNTLAPIITAQSDSDDAPRRGAFYVWTKNVG